jgi:NodT family efflux transporter outer membrane factor (OMF) lipoprotein
LLLGFEAGMNGRDAIITLMMTAAGAAGCLTGAGCMLRTADVASGDAPAAFENAPAGAPPAWPSQAWYREFASAELDDLVARAAKDNGDVAGARARVLEADARARAAGAALLPSVDAAGNADYLRGRSSQGSGHELDWFAMLTASYEVDFWGRNRAMTTSALRLADAARSERDTVALIALAAVADGYFDVLAVRERLKIAADNEDSARRLVDVIQARVDGGVASPVELAAQKSAYDAARITTVSLRQSEVESRASLALLLGRQPEGFEVRGAPLAELREPVVEAGLPSELLRRRPDLALAEANLRAAHADLAAARAAMFPTLSLTAGAGVQNPALPATVLTIPGVGPSLNLGANLTEPLFDHGRLRAGRDQAAAREAELLAVYRTAIVSALVDVEKALSAIQRLDESRSAEVEGLAQSERAFEGARLRYQAGSGDFLLLLEAQRSMYAARDQFVQYRLARLQARVALCKALGGGWTA